MRGKTIRIRVCLSAVAAGVLLTACGQRGALYLPDEGRNVVITPAQSAVQSPASGTPVEAPATTTDPTEEQRRNSTAPAK